RRLRPQQPVLVEEKRRPVRARRVPRVEGELVEVVLGGLDLAVVADLVAEAQERVLDLAPRLRDRVQVPERQLVARERDVDDVLGERAAELGAVELVPARVERSLECRLQRVERDAGLAVSNAPQRLREIALAAEEADARLVELGRIGSGRDRALRLAFVLLPVHAGDCIAHLVLLSSGWGRRGSGPGSRGARRRRASAPAPRPRAGAA